MNVQKEKTVNRDGLHEVRILADEYGILYAEDEGQLVELIVGGTMRGQILTGAVVHAIETSD